jgi:Uncharacterised protein family (UPF0158)
MAAMFGPVPLACRRSIHVLDQILCGGTMTVSFSDLQLACEFVSSGGMGENEAYLDRQSGKIYWHSEFGDNDEELPDDIDEEKYISIPDKRELDLGKPLVLDFAREFLPDDYDEVRHIFSRRGAYRRYKELLVRRDALERWYDFSNKSEAAALREWCAENGIDLSGT